MFVKLWHIDKKPIETPEKKCIVKMFINFNTSQIKTLVTHFLRRDQAFTQIFVKTSLKAKKYIKKELLNYK